MPTRDDRRRRRPSDIDTSRDRNRERERLRSDRDRSRRRHHGHGRTDSSTPLVLDSDADDAVDIVEVIEDIPAPPYGRRRGSEARDSPRRSSRAPAPEDPGSRRRGEESDRDRERERERRRRRRRDEGRETDRERSAPRTPDRSRRNSESPRKRERDRDIHGREKVKQSPATSPVKKSHIRRESRLAAETATGRDKGRRRESVSGTGSSTQVPSSSGTLSLEALAKLDRLNAMSEQERMKAEQKERVRQLEMERALAKKNKKNNKGKRVVSGAMMEEGRGTELKRRRGGGGGDYEYDVLHEKRARRRGGAGGEEFDEEGRRKKKKWLWIGLGVGLVVILIVAIAVGVSVSKKSSSSSSSTAAGSSTTDMSETYVTSVDEDINGVSHDSIPTAAQGTYLDPWTWYDLTDFNTTYTAQTVGGLSVMGLKKSYSDSVSPNSNVAALSDSFGYGTNAIRGVNLGGWLSIEPWITPSLFSPYNGEVVDEWNLCETLGSAAKLTIEKHYSTFITEDDFKDIQGAGLDHVRIPYSYWAVQKYDDEPYIEYVSWRYLLRGIEWARKYGIRVNLDLHAVPGSQNGWAHSGHQGPIGWLNGTDGDTNAQRSLDIHKKLAAFFAQDRYKNIVTLYGLVNEPYMLSLDHADVRNWTESAVSVVRDAGLSEPYLVFSDGFLTLTDWHGYLEDVDSKMILDTHQYAIFTAALLNYTHANKVSLACTGWSGLLTESVNNATGWGPTINGEFSQADTDCATYLNNVGAGTRWEGNLDTARATQLEPACPTVTDCQCSPANADVSSLSTTYKSFLQDYVEAQMYAFEKGWGWFYWTWKTETAYTWSWQSGLDGGYIPSKAYSPSYTCSGDIPDYSASGLPENY